MIRRKLPREGGASNQQLENEKVCIWEDVPDTRRGTKADRLSADQGGLEYIVLKGTEKHVEGEGMWTACQGPRPDAGLR